MFNQCFDGRIARISQDLFDSITFMKLNARRNMLWRIYSGGSVHLIITARYVDSINLPLFVALSHKTRGSMVAVYR